MDTGFIRKSPVVYVNVPDVDKSIFLKRALENNKINYDYISNTEQVLRMKSLFHIYL